MLSKDKFSEVLVVGNENLPGPGRDLQHRGIWATGRQFGSERYDVTVDLKRSTTSISTFSSAKKATATWRQWSHEDRRLAPGGRFLRARRWCTLLSMSPPVIMTAIGGALGVGAGIVIARLLTTMIGWPTIISSQAIAVAFLFSLIVGIFFGLYPANKASKFNPIEALR